MIRATIIVKGRVQAVGYRDVVEKAATELALTGTVENLPTGEVRIICEGKPSVIKEFTSKINVRKGLIFVESMDIKQTKATGEFKDFRAIGVDLQKEMPERVAMAARYLGELVEGQNKLLSGQDQLIQGQNKLLEGQHKMLGKQDQLIQGQNKLLKGQDQLIQGQNKLLKGQDKLIREFTGFRKETHQSFTSMAKKYGTIDARLRSIDQSLRLLAKALFALAKKHTK